MEKKTIYFPGLNLGASRKIWLVSDLHWNHDMAMLGRHPEWATKVREWWKINIKPLDVVFDLGDTVMGRPSQLDDILKPLPGIKILIRGNHDHQPLCWYLDKGYSAVCDQLVLGPQTVVVQHLPNGARIVQNNPHRIILNHRPMDVLPEGIAFCVHGHLHNNPLTEEYQTELSGHNELFCLERELTPVLLRDFLLSKGRLVNKRGEKEEANKVKN